MRHGEHRAVQQPGDDERRERPRHRPRHDHGDPHDRHEQSEQRVGGVAAEFEVVQDDAGNAQRRKRCQRRSGQAAA